MLRCVTALRLNYEQTRVRLVGEKEWYFPSAVSEATHDEWTVRQLLVHLELFSGIKRLEEEIAKYHARQNIFLMAAEIAIPSY